MRARFEIPGHLPSRANLHQHWRRRHAMAQRQRQAARLLTHQFVSFKLLAEVRSRGAVVDLCRVSPQQLDDDNLATAFKSTRDGIADALGLDDRDPRISWRYGQSRGTPPAALITITAVDSPAPA